MLEFYFLIEQVIKGKFIKIIFSLVGILGLITAITCLVFGVLNSILGIFFNNQEEQIQIKPEVGNYVEPKNIEISNRL